jgi:hypothetical protein
MKKIIQALFLSNILFIIFSTTSCNNSYGNEKTFYGTQVYYTASITKKEVNVLGTFLKTSGFADGVRKTVQLDKSGSNYLFRMVIKSGYEHNQEYLNTVKVFASELSQGAFGGADVEIHLCNELLTTLVIIPMAGNERITETEGGAYKTKPSTNPADELIGELEKLIDDSFALYNKILSAYDNFVNPTDTIIDELEKFIDGISAFYGDLMTLEGKISNAMDNSVFTHEDYMKVATMVEKWEVEQLMLQSRFESKLEEYAGKITIDTITEEQARRLMRVMEKIENNNFLNKQRQRP